MSARRERLTALGVLKGSSKLFSLWFRRGDMLDVAGAPRALLDGRDAGSRRDQNVDVEGGAEHRQA